MRSGDFLACDDDRRRPHSRRSEDFLDRSSGALDLEFLPDVRRMWGFHNVSHFDEDRRGKNSRRQQAFRNRLTDSMDLGFRVDVDRRSVRRDYKDDDIPYRATIPETEIVAATQKWRSSRQSWKPTRAEFLEITDEHYTRHWSAHPYSTQRTANHSRTKGSSYLKDEFDFYYFDGDVQIGEYLDWEQEIEMLFEYLRISKKRQVRFVMSKLTGRAKVWWKLLNHARHIDGRRDIQTWSKMKKLLRSQFLSSYYVSELEEPIKIVKKLDEDKPSNKRENWNEEDQERHICEVKLNITSGSVTYCSPKGKETIQYFNPVVDSQDVNIKTWNQSNEEEIVSVKEMIADTCKEGLSSLQHSMELDMQTKERDLKHGWLIKARNGDYTELASVLPMNAVVGGSNNQRLGCSSHEVIIPQSNSIVYLLPPFELMCCNVVAPSNSNCEPIIAGHELDSFQPNGGQKPTHSRSFCSNKQNGVVVQHTIMEPHILHISNNTVHSQRLEDILSGRTFLIHLRRTDFQPLTMAWILDEYSNFHDHFQVATRKPIDLGGSLGRKAATRHESVFATEALLVERGMSIKELNYLWLVFNSWRLLFLTIGDVVLWIVELILQNGGKVIVFSDVFGSIKNPNVIIIEEEYQRFHKKSMEAKNFVSTDRKKKIDAATEMIENNLILLGATAIDDKLQIGVPECIDKLVQTGIKIWVITGDKMETAINIGFSYNPLRQGMKQIIITLGSPNIVLLEKQGKNIPSCFDDISRLIGIFFPAKRRTINLIGVITISKGPTIIFLKESVSYFVKEKLIRHGFNTYVVVSIIPIR